MDDLSDQVYFVGKRGGVLNPDLWKKDLGTENGYLTVRQLLLIRIKSFFHFVIRIENCGGGVAALAPLSGFPVTAT